MDLNNKELKELIQTHENVQLEFKESKNSLPNDFWSTYSAFANTSGGYIILGVKEENNQNILSGVANYEKIKTDLFTTACNSTKVNIDLLLPDNIHVKNIDGKYIIVIYIPEAAINQKPVYINSNTTALIVEIHEPYYIFTNPGIMKIPVESFFLESRSVTRNSIIVNLFRRMGASDRAGTGSKKILNVAVKNQFKMPEIESSLEKTILKLWLAHPIDVTPGLSKIEKDIYNLFDNDMINLTAKKINELLPIYSYSQVNRSLKKLASKNLIIKLGANRNRSYTKCINKLEFIKNIDQVTKIIKSSIYTK